MYTFETLAMTSIGIKEARQNLRELIERVERGELITITARARRSRNYRRFVPTAEPYAKARH